MQPSSPSIANASYAPSPLLSSVPLSLSQQDPATFLCLGNSVVQQSQQQPSLHPQYSTDPSSFLSLDESIPSHRQHHSSDPSSLSLSLNFIPRQDYSDPSSLSSRRYASRRDFSSDPSHSYGRSIPQPSSSSNALSSSSPFSSRELPTKGFSSSYQNHRYKSPNLEEEERREEEEKEEEEFCVDCYLEIVNRLVDLPMSKVEKFFLGFEHSSVIDPDNLLKTIKIIISQEGEEEQEEERKEQIIKIVLCWRRTLHSYYQTFNPLFSNALEEFFDSLNSHLSPTLVWKEMSLRFCGTSRHVSRLLCSIMSQIYKKIRPDEFFDGFWQKEERFIRSPNIMAMNELFNRISSMVVESILFCGDVFRLKNLRFIVKLASQLFKMNNFEGCAAVLNGLNQSSIRRLKPLWQSLSSSYNKRFHIFWAMFSSKFGVEKYQKMLESEKPPILPWFAPKLNELRLLYDENQRKSKQIVDVSYLLVCLKKKKENLLLS